MARVSNTLIGPSSGRVGNAIFSTWKGINVLKEKPGSVANPNTVNQQMRRSALSQVVAAFRQMPAVIRAGFKKLAVQKSEFNAFSSAALKNSFDYSAPPTATLDPADVLISKGTISSTPITAAVADLSAGDVTITYPNTIDQPGQALSDQSIIALFNTDKNDWAGNASGELRSAGSTGISLPEDWEVGDNLVVYLGFFNPLSGESSDSVNTTTIIVA